jgi:hypothetical protein
LKLRKDSQRYTAGHLMSEESPRNWTLTYISVIFVEILVLMGLFWLQNRFRI